jgi:hypothetical protein
MHKSYKERRGCWNCGHSFEDWDYDDFHGHICQHRANCRLSKHKKPRRIPVPVEAGGYCRFHKVDPDRRRWA